MKLMKRAAIKITYEALIGFILAAILLPGLIIFVANITSIFQNKPDQSTVNNFEQLHFIIGDLMTKTLGSSQDIQTTQFGDVIKVYPSRQNSAYVEVPYYLQKGIGLIAFDSDHVALESGDAVKRPSLCLNKPCICLIKNLRGASTTEKDYQECTPLDGPIAQISASVLQEETITNYGAQGHAQGQYLVWVPSKDIGVRTLQIIKIGNQDGTTYNLLFNLLPSQ